jgi:hypothetical protein
MRRFLHDYSPECKGRFVRLLQAVAVRGRRSAFERLSICPCVHPPYGTVFI